MSEIEALVERIQALEARIEELEHRDAPDPLSAYFADYRDRIHKREQEKGAS